MNPVETSKAGADPAWDSFGISRVNFRPEWEGDLVNVFTTVEPEGTPAITERIMRQCTRAIASWILDHRDSFGPEDRFQIIVGWPKWVRQSGRQAIKTGGTYDELRDVADGRLEAPMRPGWSSGVFPENQ